MVRYSCRELVHRSLAPLRTVAFAARPGAMLAARMWGQGEALGSAERRPCIGQEAIEAVVADDQIQHAVVLASADVWPPVRRRQVDGHGPRQRDGEQHNGR